MTEHAERARLGRYLSDLLNARPEFRETVERDDQGRFVLVPLVPTDTMRQAVELVSQSGGRGTIAVRDDASPFSLALLHVRTHPIHDPHDDCPVPVGPDCTLADFLKVIVPGSMMTIDVDHGQVQVQPRELVLN